MDLHQIFIASLIAFMVSLVSVTVGGTSLITVPVLISMGMVSKNAVATNMFALIFLSMSGAFGLKKAADATHYKLYGFLSLLTVCGSLLGANLILAIDQESLKKVIAAVICIMSGSFLIRKDLGIQEIKVKISTKRLIAGALLIFILGVYGGFFSGGYVTLLSYILVLLYGLNFLQVVFVTKLFNIVSSSVACLFFYFNGLIDFSVGIPLAFSMSLGAFLGAKLAMKKGNLWVRNLFIIVVLFLAVRLFFG